MIYYLDLYVWLRVLLEMHGDWLDALYQVRMPGERALPE